ncbi:hypothetical protein C2U70_09500 [Bradyrhizobium guangdongense]|uniref:hypothetical protein n=1 Tax=Bradyrhizobium guangdongense TaxID=1325090 RepID=UPI0011290026|nr:hypothetical protein [Bradyrhizobium guangdongense]TPQ38187.1 hypothetical protein C2U70_09500 [Bradyrhizobium guangdongense]
MVLKSFSFGLVTALALAWGGGALADDYRPSDFLGMDLSKAVLSPKRLGPPTEFAPVAVEAKSDMKSDAQARTVTGDMPKQVATERVRAPSAKVAQTQHRGVARAKLAHRHGNPLDAQAMDTRIQTWPCRTGGICNWKR